MVHWSGMSVKPLILPMSHKSIATLIASNNKFSISTVRACMMHLCRCQFDNVIIRSSIDRSIMINDFVLSSGITGCQKKATSASAYILHLMTCPAFFLSFRKRNDFLFFFWFSLSQQSWTQLFIHEINQKKQIFVENYLSTGSIVVQIHQTPCVSLNFTCIEKSSSKFHAKIDVGRTAAPFPRLLMLIVVLTIRHLLAALARIASAQWDIATRTRGGDGVHGARAWYCICEGCLTWA